MVFVIRLPGGHNNKGSKSKKNKLALSVKLKHSYFRSRQFTIIIVFYDTT